MTNEAKLSRFSKDDEYTPFVVITYRYNPADTIGKFVKQKSEYHTTRGTRVHGRVSQTWSAEASLDDYSKYIKAFDKIFHGVNNVSKIRSIPDSFAIVIGIVNPALYHDGYASGEDIDYSDLFQLLSYRGFDPLKSIRNKKIQLTNELGLRIRNVVNRGGLSKEAMLTVLRGFATELCDKAKDYVYGGMKPQLAENTTDKWRASKQEKDPSLYQGKRGIREPMFETGQLHDAIGWDAIAYQSEAMKSFSDELIKAADAIKKSSRKHNERQAKLNLEKSIDKEIKRVIAAKGRGNYDDIRTLFLRMMTKTNLFSKSNIKRIPVNPSKKQIESIERKLFSFVGIRKIDLFRRLKNLKIKAGDTAELLSKSYEPAYERKFNRLMQSISDLEMKIKQHRSGFMLREIGHANLSAMADIENKINRRINTDEQGHDVESQLLGIAKAYNKMLNDNLPPSVIFPRMFREEHASRDDIRLAVIFEEAIRKYGREVT